MAAATGTGQPVTYNSQLNLVWGYTRLETNYYHSIVSDEDKNSFLNYLIGVKQRQYEDSPWQECMSDLNGATFR